MFRVVQISDTHLSPSKRHFADNWPPLAAWIAAQRPDLVVHTGDVTVDGADQDEDLHHCAGLLSSLGVPVLAVPGNHDVGDAGNPHQPVTAERIGRWTRHFAADRWIKDIEGWRLIGINALLFDSGLAEETLQLHWLAAATAAGAGRRIAWFLHRPVFLESPTEPDTGYWAVRTVPRRQLTDLIARHDVAVIASGHLHRAHLIQQGGTRYVWAPSTSFLVGPVENPPQIGRSTLGAVVYDFSPADVSIRIAEIAGLHPHVIDDVIHEVYPSRA